MFVNIKYRYKNILMASLLLSVGYKLGVYLWIFRPIGYIEYMVCFFLILLMIRSWKGKPFIMRLFVKTAVIVDGGYFTKSYRAVCGKFPVGADLWSYVGKIRSFLVNDLSIGQAELFRVFFYDCRPLDTKVKNPINNKDYDLLLRKVLQDNQKLQDQLIRQPLICLRLGELMPPLKGWSGWTARKESLKRISDEGGTIKADDLIPVTRQKGVDMRIGLDIAHLAVKKLCDQLVIISADADIIPAMKLARKEGIQVFLHVFGPLSVSLRRMEFHADALTTHREVFPKDQDIPNR